MTVQVATKDQIEYLGFFEKDFSCKCCGICRVDLYFLQRMRCFFDFTGKLEFKITSCCRCWAHHVEVYKQINGDNWPQFITRSSPHLIDNEQGQELASQAIDITGLRLHLEAINLALERPWHGGFHFYRRGEKGSSIHLDTGRRRRW